MTPAVIGVIMGVLVLAILLITLFVLVRRSIYKSRKVGKPTACTEGHSDVQRTVDNGSVQLLSAV